MGKKRSKEGPTYTLEDHERHRREVEKREAEEARQRKERVAFERAKRQWERGGGDVQLLIRDWKSIYKDIQEQERNQLLEDAQARDEAYRERQRRRPSARI